MDQLSKKSIFTAIIGDIFTLYNFAIFGYSAPIIGPIFFPNSGQLMSITKIFLLYAVGYVFRPLGGIILSHIGDTHGRKIALIISFFTISFTSLAIALLPTYKYIGYGSTLILTIIRIIQGLAAGGELSSASAYIFEIAQKRKGFWVSWNSTGAVLGVLLGSVAIMIISTTLSNQELVAFGWRIPFFLGFVLIIPSILSLKTLSESNSFKKIIKNNELENIPIASAFKNNLLDMVSVFLFSATTATIPIIFVWLPSYANSYLNQTISNLSIINTITLSVLVLLMPIAGWFSDNIGYLKLAIISMILMLISSIPLFSLMIYDNQHGIFITQLIFAIIFSGTAATTSILITKQFPTKIRCSGIAVSYNTANIAFGGTAPIFCTFLISTTGIQAMPAYYLMFCMFIALCGCLIIYKRKGLCKKKWTLLIDLLKIS